jgi:hypothetical protein
MKEFKTEQTKVSCRFLAEHAGGNRWSLVGNEAGR